MFRFLLNPTKYMFFGMGNLNLGFNSGCRTVSNNGSGSGLAPAQNILAVQVWFGFTCAPFSRFRFGSGSLK